MEQSRPRVALLIDGDNSASISIPSVLAEAGKLGDVMIRRVYGNWSLSSMHAWQEIAPRYGLEQQHHGKTAPGKNATDIAMVVDAMGILYSGAIEHFCLVTSDSDYTPPGAAAPVCRVPGTCYWQTDDTSCLANGLYGVCFD